MKALILTILTLSALPDKEAAILLLSGASSLEELSEDELDRYESLNANPVRINMVSRSRLLSCGLFSAYQVASLLEYIGRTGDILSFTELSAVNGFGEERADALRHFVSLESRAPPGKTHRRNIRQDAMARAEFKEAGNRQAGKYHMEMGETAELYLSGRNTLSSARPELNAASLCYYGKTGLKGVLGDFNARFGQGLLCWSSFSLSGFPSISSFRRNGSGFSPTGSFSPAHRGIALEWDDGKWGVGGAYSLQGLLLASISHLGMNHRLGAQAFRKHQGPTGASIDWKAGYGHFIFYGEAAAEFKEDGKIGPAVLTGLGWAPAYKVRAELLARYYSPEYGAGMAGAARSASKVTDEAGLSAGVSIRNLSFTADASIHPQKRKEGKKNYAQLKTLATYSPSLTMGAVKMEAGLRWAERCYRSPAGDEWKNDLRADISAGTSGWKCTARMNAVQVGDSRPGWLSYLEGAYRSPSDSCRMQFSLTLRACSFSIPDWNSRIYAYERSLPGCFSVPAYYGCGRSFSFTAGWKLRVGRIGHRIEAAASCIRSDKSSKTEFRIQYRLQL